MPWRLITVVLLMVLVKVGLAQEVPCQKRGSCLGDLCRWKNCPSQGCCPDDYCRKPFPCIKDIPRCGGPDDYCRKPFPCITDIPRCGGPDDYCSKPLPVLLCPPASPHLKCGPSTGCCSKGHGH